MKYSRANFKSWLETLPDRPFCETGKCPISQFLGLPLSAGGAEDEDLANRIDALCHDELKMPWEQMLPSQVILIIDSAVSAGQQK